MQVNKMKAIRHYLGMTQEEFGSKLGVSPATISFVEKGRRNMSSKLAAKLARIEMGLEDDFYTFQEKFKQYNTR